MLVVADERPRRVRRQRRLARSRKPEEESDVLGSADVAARVQREHAPLWHQVVHDAEDALLHLAGVLRAQDDHLARLQVDVDRRRARHEARVSVHRKRASVEDRKVRGSERRELCLRGADQHVVHDEGVVGPGAHDADLDAAAWREKRERELGGEKSELIFYFPLFSLFFLSLLSLFSLSSLSLSLRPYLRPSRRTRQRRRSSPAY